MPCRPLFPRMPKMTSGNNKDIYIQRMIEAGIDINDARFEMELMAEAAHDAAELESFVARRIQGEPCAYIVGYRDFFKERYKVTPDVLIPRSDTEILVETVLTALGLNELPVGKMADIPRMEAGESLAMLDLCTGSGCVGISLANEIVRRGIKVSSYLTDVSSEALEVASGNARTVGREPGCFVVEKQDVRIGGIEKIFDIITANPPYIDGPAMEELPADVRKEPSLALYGGADGLEYYRAIAANYCNNVTNGGILAVEHGFDQSEKVRRILSDAGFKDVDTIEDYGGNPRVTYGFKR